MMERVASEGAIVPDLWPPEVANAIMMQVRRRRLTMEQAEGLATRARTFNVTCDAETGARALTQTFRLAANHGLTAYDASYLELAQRFRLPLISLDAKLRRAATAERVPTLPA